MKLFSTFFRNIYIASYHIIGYWHLHKRNGTWQIVWSKQIFIEKTYICSNMYLLIRLCQFFCWPPEWIVYVQYTLVEQFYFLVTCKHFTSFFDGRWVKVPMFHLYICIYRKPRIAPVAFKVWQLVIKPNPIPEFITILINWNVETYVVLSSSSRFPKALHSANEIFFLEKQKAQMKEQKVWSIGETGSKTKKEIRERDLKGLLAVNVKLMNDLEQKGKRSGCFQNDEWAYEYTPEIYCGVFPIPQWESNVRRRWLRCVSSHHYRYLCSSSSSK